MCELVDASATQLRDQYEPCVRAYHVFETRLDLVLSRLHMSTRLLDLLTLCLKRLLSPMSKLSIASSLPDDVLTCIFKQVMKYEFSPPYSDGSACMQVCRTWRVRVLCGHVDSS